jgi:hypothetical protein
MIIKIFPLLILSFLFANGLLAQNDKSSTIIVKEVEDFVVTGEGSAAAWEKTDWVNLPQRKTETNFYETKAKVLYSETGIYFLFDCQDKQLNSSFKKDNENLWEEDVVEVFLWTDETFPLYFEYELSPLNYELPIIIPNNKGKFYGWLPWHYEGERKTRHATSVRGGKKKSGAAISGWMAEIFIPYKLLAPLQNVPPESGTEWRANMYRIDHDNGQTLFSWQEIEKSFHEYKNFGTFIFE